MTTHLEKLDRTEPRSHHLRAVLTTAVNAGGGGVPIPLDREAMTAGEVAAIALDATIDRMTDRQVAAAALDVVLALGIELARARNISLYALVDELLATHPDFDPLGG